MTERISLQSRSYHEEEQGRLSEKWKTVKSVWASLVSFPLSKSINIKSKGCYHVRIRQTKKSFDAILWDKKRYVIVSGLKMDPRGMYLEFCVEDHNERS